MIGTKLGIDISEVNLANYFNHMVGAFYKVLCIWEDDIKVRDKTLPTYLNSLQSELIGANEFFEMSKHDADSYIISLISILQYIYDNPDLDKSVVKREVFKSISLCKKIEGKFRGDANA